jgi:PHD/YefM family antitoxin component YafN of YafNO toxin-antitoxin module
MNTLSLQEASSNLPRIIENTRKNGDETLIVSELGAVIMVDESYWEEIQETLRLLRDKKSLTALLDGHHQRDKGIIPQGRTISEVFNDLQEKTWVLARSVVRGDYKNSCTLVGNPARPSNISIVKTV